ncbi:FecR family protein [Pedobacter sp. MW01-1-1]|uniref:FecR family protein n=1 Tax=Pedobacter sp. MW01-1-1 TaxID=3383027 RepID=UPI003FEF8726
MPQINAEELLKKYKMGTCTDAEIALLESWYLEKSNKHLELSPQDVDQARENIWKKLSISVETPKKGTFSVSPYQLIAAALVIGIASICLYLFSIQKENETPKIVKSTPIIPGEKKAILTLANGEKLALTAVKNGSVTNHANAHIIKTTEGEIEYHSEQNNLTPQVNQLTVPNGGYFTVTLADGTKIWLNSASNLKYPTVFNEKERIVELSGEAYFEVAHKNGQPFKVISKGQTIQVLGTHFNIQSYSDEKAVVTSLIEGSVQVMAENKKTVLLKPGQQSINSKNTLTVNSVNLDGAISWVSNEFYFDDEELGSIMRKIARWYDVEIVCPDNLTHLKFTGSISRTRSIQKVLAIMQLTESLHFKYEGRRITVMP